ncbi:hypothetical protein D3C75_1231340 [compost metagenome]
MGAARNRHDDSDLLQHQVNLTLYIAIAILTIPLDYRLNHCIQLRHRFEQVKLPTNLREYPQTQQDHLIRVARPVVHVFWKLLRGFFHQLFDLY